MIKTTIQQAKMIFVYMLKHPQYLLQIGKDFFEQDDLQYIAMTARQFYKEYKEVPSCEQMKMIVKNEDKDNIKPETIESYYHVDIDPMDKEWLKSTTEGWIKYRTLMSNFSKAATLIKTSDISLENVIDVVDKATEIVSNTNMVNFDRDLGVDFFDVDNHKNTNEDKIHYTWDFWNKSSAGGLDPKTLMVYIAGTNVGKSIILCNDAVNFVRTGKNVIFITCEMSPQKVLRRMSANLLDITLEEYDKLVENPSKLKKKIQNTIGMSMFPMGKLIIKEFATGQGTTLDVERYVKEVQDVMKFKVDVVVIDYINIMSNYRHPNSENTYMKVKTLAEDLRGLAVKYNFLIVTASQIGRSAWNNSDINLEDVSESAGLAHTADSVIGVIQTEDMRIGEIDEDTGIAVPYYWFKILKIREGENKNKKFKVTINYSKMKLTEQVDEIDTSDHFR